MTMHTGVLALARDSLRRREGIVPEGAVTDFASIPLVAQPLCP
jgi:hypothetical protein